MIRNGTFAQPAPPAGQSIAAIRQWCLDMQRSLDSCAAALRTLQATKHTTNAPRDEGGAGDPPPTDPATYVTIGSAAEGNEAAETTTWNYGTDGEGGDGKGIWFYAQSRSAYYHAGDKKVYGYVRKIKVDTYGRIYEIGAETRFEIDATVT